MKYAYMTNGVGGRCLAFVTAFSLCACSVLQIDVDEYKGPLSNHEDIQLQQYAALAISAKPIIVELRSRYLSDEKDKNRKKHDQICEKNNYDEYSGCRFELEIVQFLNSILALYEDEYDVFQKESIESLREKNLADVELLQSRASKVLKRLELSKWFLFVKEPEKQNNIKTYLASIELLEKKILKGNTVKEQEDLKDEVSHKQEIPEEDTLEKINSSIAHNNTTLVNQSKSRGIHKTEDIQDFIDAQRSSDNDSKKFDCITQKEKQSDIHDNARDTCGINRLTTNFIDSINKESASPNEGHKNKVRIAKERLNESLILFAEKILFIVNNHSLAFGNGTPNDNNSANNHSLSFDNGTANYDKATNNGYAKKFAVLQSLGNTLIVHANDLRRRATHDQRLVDRKDSELAAARLAFAPGAQKAFDILVQELGVTIQEKENKKTALQNTLQIKNISPQTIEKKQIDLVNSQTGLTGDAQSVQKALDAYRTAFGNYDIKVEGINPTDRLVASDQREITSLFSSNDEKNRSADNVLTELQKWFNENKIKPRGTVPPQASEYARRNNAQDYFSHLFACNGNSPASECRGNLGIAVGTYKEVFEKLREYVLVGLNEDKLKLEGRQNAINNGLQALITFKKNESQLSDMTKAHEAIKSIKQTVLQQAETAKIDNVFGLRNLLLLELEKQSPSKSDLEKDKYLSAVNVLKEMSVSKSFQFVGGSEVKNQRDVLDDVIAQLQHQRLEAASRGADITALNKALELAYEQRGGLAYLRSATAYLRNAFANTSLQDGNKVCGNLLIPSIFCQDGYEQVFKETKLEIDKQFWQTINTVKVRGGGATDFAIVKDDVGNWYVKGLSSDPESIIKSAQSLALFNMGGKVNLDLLGQVETRRELAKLKIDDPNRQVLKDELKAKQSGSGANTAGLEKVLAKYRKEYLDATTMNVDGLIGKLDQLPIDITAAWQGINFDETPKASFGKLTALLGTPAELVVAKKLLEDAKAVLAQGNALAAGTAKAAASEKANISASDAIVKSLVEVRNMRSRLVKAITQDDELIAAKRDFYEDAKAGLKAQDIIVAGEKKKWEKADMDVTNKQALLDAMTVPAKIDEQQKTLTAAKETLKIAQDALDTARSKYDEAVRIARKKLSDAFKTKQERQIDVDTFTAQPPSATRDALLAAAKAVLTAAEAELVTAEKELAEISIPSQAVTDAKKARDEAKTGLAVQEVIFNNLTASSAIEEARTHLTTAKRTLATAKTEWDGAEVALAGLRTAAKEAENAYTLAKSNRLAAARKVTMLANALIETTAANRLEAVKAYEVAIGFVGQTAGGQ